MYPPPQNTVSTSLSVVAKGRVGEVGASNLRRRIHEEEDTCVGVYATGRVVEVGASDLLHIVTPHICRTSDIYGTVARSK